MGVIDSCKVKIELVYINCVYSLVVKGNVMFKFKISWIGVYILYLEDIVKWYSEG